MIANCILCIAAIAFGFGFYWLARRDKEDKMGGPAVTILISVLTIILTFIIGYHDGRPWWKLPGAGEYTITSATLSGDNWLILANNDSAPKGLQYICYYTLPKKVVHIIPPRHAVHKLIVTRVGSLTSVELETQSLSHKLAKPEQSKPISSPSNSP